MECDESSALEAATLLCDVIVGLMQSAPAISVSLPAGPSERSDPPSGTENPIKCNDERIGAPALRASGRERVEEGQFRNGRQANETKGRQKRRGTREGERPGLWEEDSGVLQVSLSA